MSLWETIHAESGRPNATAHRLAGRKPMSLATKRRRDVNATALTDKGKAVVKRYQESGATAENSREYRARTYALAVKLANHDLAQVIPEKVWTKKELREMSVCAVRHWLRGSSWHHYIGNHTAEWQEFCNRL